MATKIHLTTGIFYCHDQHSFYIPVEIGPWYIHIYKQTNTLRNAIYVLWCCLKENKIQQHNHLTGRKCYPGYRECFQSGLHWTWSLNLSHATLGNFTPLLFICTQCHSWLPFLLLLWRWAWTPIPPSADLQYPGQASTNQSQPRCSLLYAPAQQALCPHPLQLAPFLTAATTPIHPQSRAPSHPLSRAFQSHPHSSGAAHTAAPRASNNNTSASPHSTKMAPIHHPSATQRENAHVTNDPPALWQRMRRSVPQLKVRLAVGEHCACSAPPQWRHSGSGGRSGRWGHGGAQRAVPAATRRPRLGAGPEHGGLGGARRRRR